MGHPFHPPSVVFSSHKNFVEGSPGAVEVAFGVPHLLGWYPDGSSSSFGMNTENTQQIVTFYFQVRDKKKVFEFIECLAHFCLATLNTNLHAEFCSKVNEEFSSFLQQLGPDTFWIGGGG